MNLSELLHVRLSRWEERIVALLYLNTSALSSSVVEPCAAQRIREGLAFLATLPPTWGQMVCQTVLGNEKVHGN